MTDFPAQQPGVRYLTEGGQETELMYKHGHELPEFAMYPLLDDPKAMDDLRRMYAAVVDVAVSAGLTPLLGGLDYRASPDWAGKLGYSLEDLVDLQHRCIGFLREVVTGVDGALVMGCVGPRGDAYGEDRTITADEAEDYHAVQLQTLKEADVDLASAMTFGSVPEAVGVARAASRVGLPLSLSFMVDAQGRLTTGVPLREAVLAVDEQAGDDRPAFYGVNCSHPQEFSVALDGGEWQQRLRILRPNASTADKGALCQLGELDAGDPAGLGVLMGQVLRDLPQVDVVGGCCGTWDDHLRAIAENLPAAVS